ANNSFSKIYNVNSCPAASWTVIGFNFCGSESSLCITQSPIAAPTVSTGANWVVLSFSFVLLVFWFLPQEKKDMEMRAAIVKNFTLFIMIYCWFIQNHAQDIPRT